MLMSYIISYLSTIDFYQTNPEIIGEVFKLIKKLIDNDDLYVKIREYYNLMFLDKETEFKQIINESNNDFLIAIKYAIIANIIDSSPITNKNIENVIQYFNELKDYPLTINHHLNLLKDIKQSKTLLYLSNNCGVICLDKILIKKLKN